jgi:hypothetical protein
MRYEPHATSPNILGGYSGNARTAGVYGATISGGGTSGSVNTVTDIYGTVGGGVGNTAGDNAGTVDDTYYCTVGGGYYNTASGHYAAVGGGNQNTASGGYGSAITGGYRNTASGSIGATVCGGYDNVASGTSGATVVGGRYNTASGQSSTVCGGWDSTASGKFSTVAGGYENATPAGNATVSGGSNNTASGWCSGVGSGDANAASGHYSAVPGGQSNAAAGQYTLAAGRRAQANHDGAFVWADSTDADFASSAANELSARATGGVRLFVDTAGSGLRLQPHATSPNIIAGHANNAVTVGVRGAAIGGGGGSFINQVTDHYGTVGGGLHNQAGDGAGGIDDAEYATVAGGNWNTASGECATIGGGYSNTASGHQSVIAGGYDNSAAGTWAAVGGGEKNEGSGENATVGGGEENIASGLCATVGGGGGYDNGQTTPHGNTASGDYATVGGGTDNTASGTGATVAGGGAWSQGNTAGASYAAVGGGYRNTAGDDAATVGGGYFNQAKDAYNTIGGGWSNIAGHDTEDGTHATIAGGYSNEATRHCAAVGGGRDNGAHASFATVPGGQNNNADGEYSFAAGRRAKANHDGAFVWADSTNADFASSTADEFAVRATGGIQLHVDTNGGGLRVLPRASSAVLVAGHTANTAAAAADGAVISGGGSAVNENKVTDSYGTVGGGSGNQAGDDAGTVNDAMSATVAGGFANTASGPRAAVGGGWSNAATGSHSTIPGGSDNDAVGAFSFAAGRLANANHDGTFVWADSTFASFGSTGSDQFLIRAGGGVGIGLNNPAEALDVSGNIKASGLLNSAGSVVVDGTNRRVLSTGDLYLYVGSNTRALQIEYDSTSPNLIGGYTGNSVTTGVHGATISGGGNSGSENQVTDHYGTVGGGAENQAGNGTGTVDDAWCTTVAGGFYNNATGDYATVPGGRRNDATGGYSFAAGRRAKANHDGTFVWADSTDADFTSTGTDQFLIRADGGVGVGTNTPISQLHVRENVSGSGAFAANHVACIGNTNSSMAQVLALRMTNLDNPSASNNFVTFFDSNEAVGAIEGDGSGGVTLDTTSSDFAEYLPKACPNEELGPGDIVGLAAGRIGRATRGAERAMVVSTAPAVRGNRPKSGNESAHAAVAFVGQVPVRVRGPVRAGDYVVPSAREDGTGVAVSPQDLTAETAALAVGRALEAGGREEVSRVRVLVGLPRDAGWRALLERRDARLEALERRLAALESRGRVPLTSAALCAGLLFAGAVVWRRRRNR